ncbi:MAG: tetratricopeptide repeat protein, partial [Cyanobacteria bacterium J06631_2]
KSFQQTDQELSLYTKYFVEGIETGAAEKKEQGKIYAVELHEYAKAKVQEAKPKQQPAIIIDREGYNIILSQVLINDPELVSPEEKSEILSKSPSSKMTVKDYFNRALDQERKGDYQGVIADYERAIELQPDYANAYNNRGNVYKNLKDA